MNHYAMRGGSSKVMAKVIPQSMANGWIPISIREEAGYQTVIFKQVT